MDNVQEPQDATDSSNIAKATSDDDTNYLTSDRILDEIGGLGPYQILVALSTAVALLLASFSMFNFIFAANIPEHRCWIPECESSDSSVFHADWTKYAIPLKNDALDSCSRYAPIPSTINGLCSVENFNQSQIIPCDGYITKNREERLVSHLNLFCTEREKSMPLIGTASTAGKVAGILFTGIVSDKLGRLHTFVGGLFLGSILGCLQTLPAPFMSFELFAGLEFLAAFVTSGILAATCAFNMEWAPAHRRTLLNSIALSLHTLHPAIMGIAAWYFEANFVGYKLIFAVSGFIVILIYFVLSEPPQWLLARHKYARLIKCIKSAGRLNGSPPSAKLIEQIQSQPLRTADNLEIERSGGPGDQVTIRGLFKHKVLVIRLFVLALAWLAKIYAFYGITLGSVKVHDNQYVSYILIGMADIPGALLSMLIIDRLGRRKTICISLLGYGALMVASTQIPIDLRTLKLILFFISRATLKVSTIAFFVYALELWPTAIRSTVFNIGSLAGRIGGMLATLSIMLAEYHEQLPIMLNGCATIVAAVLVFVCLPDTMHCTKPPDTFDEALAIGKSGTFKPESAI